MTETDICNLALGMLAHDRAIASDFRSDTSTEAVRCRLFFDSSRIKILSCGAPWTFALENMTTCAETPGAFHDPDIAPGWRFSLPAGCLHVVRVHDPFDERAPVDFRPCGTEIYVDECDTTIIYVDDTTDLTLWPQCALDALAAELAARLAGPMTGKAEKASAARADADRALSLATLWNARQTPPRAPADDRYIRARSAPCADSPGIRR